ncbi:MAG: TonB-dependent receptor [Prevotella sp.]|nr:TonB-dependent receptor [Prevotella sp.]
MKRLLAIIIINCQLSIINWACAEELNDSVTLSQIVVTGTRTPKTLASTPVATRLITQKDIERTDATNIQDLLQQEMPGVEFTYAMNQQTHLNFSGFGGQSILFLADGERLAGETMDDVDFSRLIMTGVGRIEVVRGAASALYGSNAGGGVVNIITGTTTGTTLHLDSRWSKHGGQRYGLMWGLNGKRWQNQLTATFSDKNNYTVTSGANPESTVISEVYGQKVVNVKDRLTYQVTDNLRLTGRLGYYFRQVPRVVTEPERYRDFSAGLKALWDITKRDNLEVGYAFDQYDKSSKQQATGLELRTYSNVQNSVRALYNHTLQSGDILTVGGDFMRDYLYNTKLTDPRKHQNSVDGFAQYDWNISDQWEMVGALRYDYFSASSLSRVTPKISVRYTPLLGETEGGLTLRASYGMGFRAPSLKEMYSDFDMAGIWIIQGNPDLKAETSHNLNLSAEYSHGRYDLMVMGYYNNVRNKITTGVPYSSQSQLYLPYINLDKYYVYGAEVMARAQWGEWGAKVSYAYTNEDGNGNNNVNQYLAARKHALTWEGTWDKDIHKNYGLSVTLSGRFLSAMDNTEYVNISNPSQGTKEVHYPAYMLWKLTVMQRMWEKVKMTLTLDNILSYKPKYYYLNAPITDGIDVMLGLSIDL